MLKLLNLFVFFFIIKKWKDVVTGEEKNYPLEEGVEFCAIEHFSKRKLTKISDIKKFLTDDYYRNWRCMGMCGAKRFFSEDVSNDGQWCYKVGEKSKGFAMKCKKCDFILCGDCYETNTFEQMKRKHRLSCKK